MVCHFATYQTGHLLRFAKQKVLLVNHAKNTNCGGSSAGSMWIRDKSTLINQRHDRLR